MTHYVGVLDGGGKAWGVRIPDLPGCYGGGTSPEAAIEDAMSAARDWIGHREARANTSQTAHPRANLQSELVHRRDRRRSILMVFSRAGFAFLFLGRTLFQRHVGAIRSARRTIATGQSP